MQELKIGDEVRIIAILEWYYDENRVRRYRRLKPLSTHGYITGKKRRFLGKYRAGGTYSSTYCDSPDYAPPYLQVTGSMQTWLFRKSMTNREQEALDQDVIKLY